MSLTRSFWLFCVLGAFAESSFCATYIDVDFENLAAPSGCIRTVTNPPATVSALPELKVPGVTISGGQVLNYANPYQTANNVYYTMNGCAGVQPTMTITFDGPASNFNMVVGTIWGGSVPLRVQDDLGDNQTITLLSSDLAGQSISLPKSGIRKITLSLASSTWTQSSQIGFYIDNLSFYLTQSLSFVDPVPELMSGTGVTSDPESLANLGTLVKGVAADGAARVVLTAQASHVGEVIEFSVLSDNGTPSSSTQQDGGIASVGASPGSKTRPALVTSSGVGPVSLEKEVMRWFRTPAS